MHHTMVVDCAFSAAYSTTRGVRDMVLETLFAAACASTGMSPVGAAYLLAGLLFPVQTLTLTMLAARGAVAGAALAWSGVVKPTFNRLVQ